MADVRPFPALSLELDDLCNLSSGLGLPFCLLVGIALDDSGNSPMKPMEGGNIIDGW